MRIYRQMYTVPDPRRAGKRVTKKSKKWYIEYKDENGKWKRVAGFEDKRATEHMGHELQAQSDRIRAGLLSRAVMHLDTPIDEHVAAFAADLAARGRTAKHAELTRQRVDATITGCGFATLADLDGSAVTAYLARRREDPDSPISVATSNHYLRAVKTFGKWLLDSGRIEADPFATLKLKSEAGQHVRRAMSDSDFAKLLRVVEENGVRRRGMSAIDRRMLYLVAAYSGLRIGELASLTPESFALEAKPPTISVRAEYSKRRRHDVQPIGRELAEILAPWLATKERGQRVFRGWRDWPTKGFVMIAADLADAGIPYRDEQGRVFDFHALRSQFITGLARAGVGLAQAQKLARHSTPTLTAKSYTHLEQEELAAEAERLPKPPR